MKDIVFVGFGGHAKSIADCIEQCGDYSIVGYCDREDRKVTYPYLGTDDELQNIFESGVRHAVIGIGYMGKGLIRNGLYATLKEIGFILPVIIDPSAIISKSVIIGDGTFVGKRAVLNADVRVGACCIINTGAIVEHESAIGKFTHVAVGANVCGNVIIGNECLVGSGSTIIQGITIGDNVIIGAGTTVIGDIQHKTTYYGLQLNK